jgi:ATP-dependent Clp protease ATP-binding subunit ClpB
VILLDEIEKAHPDVFNILLQVLDDGRLTDNKGRTANFKNTILIMTSNIGSHIIQEKYDNYDEVNKDEIMASAKLEVFDLLKRSIRPEFLNRIDEVIMFTPLSRDEVRKIVELQFRNITSAMNALGFELQATDEVMDWLGELGYDPQFGARPLKRVLQREVLNELSKQIIAGSVNKDHPILLKLDKGKLVFQNT